MRMCSRSCLAIPLTLLAKITCLPQYLLPPLPVLCQCVVLVTWHIIYLEGWLARRITLAIPPDLQLTAKPYEEPWPPPASIPISEGSSQSARPKPPFHFLQKKRSRRAWTRSTFNAARLGQCLYLQYIIVRNDTITTRFCRLSYDSMHLSRKIEYSAGDMLLLDLFG